MDRASIDLRRLRYFIAVCEHGGFSRASSFIGVAQPSLTRHIKLLEKEIGFALINRTGRGAEPTSEGRFLLARSRQHIDGLDKVVRELRHRSSTMSGRIVLGVCPTIAPFFVEDLRAHVRDTHPGVSLSVVEAYSGDLKALMDRNDVDLSLTTRPSSPEGVVAVDLFSERLVVVTAYNEAADQRARGLDEISRSKLILPSGLHELRHIVDRACADRSIKLEPELELDSLDAVKAIIAGTSMQYCTILPYHIVSREAGDHRLSRFDIAEDAMQRTISVLVPRNGANIDRSAFLVEYLRDGSALLKSRLAAVY
jgi:LysR family nitrogen assimilation transcriptional regulator